MKLLTNAIHWLESFGYHQPYWGAMYVLMNVQGFLNGKVEVV